MKKKYAVIIGRFQPFHLGHKQLLDTALSLAENVIVVVGSSHQARTHKNPFTFDVRVSIILGSVLPSEASRLSFVGVADTYYNDDAWVMEVEQQVYNIAGNSEVLLVGHVKDDSSYYIKKFVRWPVKLISNKTNISATEIREAYYNNIPETVEHMLPSTYVAIKSAIRQGLVEFREEYLTETAYKASWASAPYPPIFLTVDNVVVQNNYLLLIRRKNAPGKGLLALPGGYVDVKESLSQSALRELIEETKIKILPSILKQYQSTEPIVFDYPGRSTRGRVVTNVFTYRLPDGLLPVVSPADDASEAVWLPIWDVATHSNEFFEDHFSIIKRCVFSRI